MPVILRWCSAGLLAIIPGCSHDATEDDPSGPPGSTGPVSTAESAETSPADASTGPVATSTTQAPTGGSLDDTGPGLDVPYFDVGGIADLGAGAVCSSDLKRVLDGGTGLLLETCGPDEGCYEGQCIPACLAAAGADGSMGCDFLVPTSPFYANGNPGAQQSGPCHALLVANPWDRPAELELSYDGVPYDVDMVTRIPDGIAASAVYDPLPASGVPSGQVAVVFLSHRPGVSNGTTLECPIPPAVLADTAAHGTDSGVAFELVSDTPIQVYDIIPYGGASTYLPSASLLFPTSAWGDGYLALTPHTPDGSEWLLVVARDDGTTVSFQPTVGITGGTITNPPQGMVTTYAMNAGDVLQWQSTADMVGSILAADHPIGVFSGNTYLRVDTADNPVSGRDSSHQMIPDVNALASEYVGAGLFSRLAGFAPESVLYRVVGVVDGTVLDWDAAPPMGAPTMISAGEVVEFQSRDTFSVRSQDGDHPFSLSQYMSGTLSGQPGCGSGGGNCQLGDDEWVVLVPPAQFLDSYTFFVDPTYGTSTLVMVREAGPTGFADVELDCMGVVGGWQPVGNDGRFEYAHVELYRSSSGMVPACETSQQHAESSGSFGVAVWGSDEAASYGYAAGGNLQTINGIDVTPAG